MADLVGLLCIVSLLAILGGGVVLVLFGVRGTVALLRGWLDGR